MYMALGTLWYTMSCCVCQVVLFFCRHQKQVATPNSDSLVVCRPLHVTTHHKDCQKVISSKAAVSLLMSKN